MQDMVEFHISCLVIVVHRFVFTVWSRSFLPRSNKLLSNRLSRIVRMTFIKRVLHFNWLAYLKHRAGTIVVHDIRAPNGVQGAGKYPFAVGFAPEPEQDKS